MDPAKMGVQGGTAGAKKMSREYMEITTGGLAPYPTSHTLNFAQSYTSYQGCEYAGLEHFGKNNL